MGQKTAIKTSAISPKNIFCLEGNWWGSLEHTSTVTPIFDLVSQIHSGLKYIHRFVSTREEFNHYLRIWSQRKYSGYPILYLAFHGSDRTLYLGDQRRRENMVDIDGIAEILRGRCRGRIIHIGACDTVGGDRRHLSRFLKTTGAAAICGYRDDVGWLDSAAFEVLFLDIIQKRAMNRSGLEAARRDVSKYAAELARSLGFSVEMNGQP